MLKDYDAGAMAHLDEREQESILESIKRRIAEIDARMQAFDGQAEAPRRAGPKA